MPIRSNGYFNNPAFAQAAQNLSSLFEPPSGADAAGFATADAKRQEAQRLADYFTQSQDPNVDLDALSRTGLGVGAFDFRGSKYGVDQGEFTARRGQDVTAATSLQNNRLSELGKLYGSLAPGHVRPELPADLASQFGAPRALPAESGAPIPLSETQLNAQRIQTMPPELQDAIAFGNTPVENVQTPTGPQIQTRLDSIGEQPFVKDTTGLSVTLPDGTVVAQGGKSTEAENKMGFAGAMAEPASNDLIAAFDTGALPTGTDYQMFNLMRNTPMAAHPALVSQMTPQGQTFYQNLRIALPYQLMAKSGLAVTEQEYARTLAELVPVPGEDPAVTASKRRQFATFVSVIQGLAGQAWAKAKMNPPAPPPELGATPAPAAPPAPAAGGAARFERGPDGKLIRVQ